MSLYDAVTGLFGGKKGKDVNLPNERPVSPQDSRWKEHRQRLTDDTVQRVQKVSDNVRNERIRELRAKGLSERDAIRKAYGATK